MRMPWNFLSGLGSRKASQEKDAEKLPAPAVLSLKIRVADSAALPEHSPSSAETPVVEESRSKADVAPETAAAPSSNKDKAEIFHIDIHTSENDLELLEGSGSDETQAAADEVVSVSSIRSPEAAEEPQINLAMEPAQAIQTAKIPTLQDKQVQAVADSQRRVAKPPIIDLPSTRNRSANGDMAELDLEIAELRRALSSKLSLQNEQLRQLLERFHGS